MLFTPSQKTLKSTNEAALGTWIGIGWILVAVHGGPTTTVQEASGRSSWAPGGEPVGATINKPATFQTSLNLTKKLVLSRRLNLLNIQRDGELNNQI